MAALTDAMKWYNLGGLKAARTKYHFQVEFYNSNYVSELQNDGRLIFDAVRTIELPKYSIETEVINSWNVRQLIPTKIVFEPITISFTDTLDNRFQQFIRKYMAIVSGNFVEITSGFRYNFDDIGIKLLETNKDCPIDKIVITRFYGADGDRIELNNKSITTLWRPKIIDVQHDTLDYSASEAVTWQISLRYESVTYEEETEPKEISPNRAAVEEPAPIPVPEFIQPAIVLPEPPEIDVAPTPVVEEQPARAFSITSEDFTARTEAEATEAAKANAIAQAKIQFGENFKVNYFDTKVRIIPNRQGFPSAYNVYTVANGVSGSPAALAKLGEGDGL